MDVLFITPMQKLKLNQEINGTLLLTTKLLQADFDVRVLRFAEITATPKDDYPAFIEEITNRILEISPRCVSFYTLWPYYHITLRIASNIKKRDSRIITVLGGPQASATADATMRSMPFVDYICTGEGENTIVPFMEAILRKNGTNLSAIPGLYYRENDAVIFNHQEIPLCDLNTLPRWDDRLFLQHYRTPEPDIHSEKYFMPIDAGRGCPYSCTFCCTSNFWRRMYRLKSPERIVADITYFNKKFGINSFWFSHDAFTTNKKLVTDVCDHILKTDLKITWKCTSRIDCLSNDLILKMKQAGLTNIELGIESGSLRLQKLINKNLDLTKAKTMIDFLLKNDIQVGLFFMYGFPEETEEDLNETLELAFSLLDSGVNHVSMSFCRFNPTTDITDRYFDRLVLDKNMKELYRGVHGYNEEIQMIQDHKELFPFMYHLDTPVRNEYHYLFVLARIYQMYHITIRHLRKLYFGDNLKFYKDFFYNNSHIFEQDIDVIVKNIKYNSLTMLYNTLKEWDVPYLHQLKELLRFEEDRNRVFKSKENITITDTYGFNYYEFKLNLSIEQYSEGASQILFQKKDGKAEMRILSVS